MSSYRSTLLIQALLLACPQAVLGQPLQSRVAKLKYEVPREWSLHLPEEGWQPVLGTLTLNGTSFTTELDEQHRLHLDTDADGRVDEKVSGTRAQISLRARTAAGSVMQYELRLRHLADRWEWSPRGMMSGRVEGQRLRLIDLDGDGQYDDYGKDAMLVGLNRAASYLSKVASIDGALFHLQVSEDGTRVSTRPYQGPVARLSVTEQFEADGNLNAAVFRAGELSFELSSEHQGLLVPANQTYLLASGRVSRGREVALIRTGTMVPITLAPGEERVLRWGAPLEARFKSEVEGGTLTVFSNLQFIGSAGEEYVTFAPDASSPLIEVRELHSDKVIRRGRMGGCCGGGFSAYVARVPEHTDLVVNLEHRRKLFGTIRGRNVCALRVRVGKR